jgi:hypothetical protein
LDEFNNKISTCDGCSEKWIKENSLKSWYVSFKAYSAFKNSDDTSVCKDSWDSTNEVVVSSKYYTCLSEFVESPQGISEK